MKHRHPTPAAIRDAIQAAVHDHDEHNPRRMFPAYTLRIINDAITKCCEDHYATRGKADEK